MYVIKSNRKTNSYTVRKINRVTQVVRVGRRGLQGETGPQGPKGDQGDPATNLVQSVNGKQGVVVLNATDVGADPTGSSAQALVDAKAYTDSESAQALQDAKDYTDTEVSTLDSSLATVAKTGSYDDLSNKPTIPSIAGLATETYVNNAVAPKANTSDLGTAAFEDVEDLPVSTAQQTALNAKANASDTVNLTGNQTIAGVKTFSSSPVVPTATTGTQAVNKAQMDAADALKVNKAGDTMTGALVLPNSVLTSSGIFTSNANSILGFSHFRNSQLRSWGVAGNGEFGIWNDNTSQMMLNVLNDRILLGGSTGIIRGTGFPNGVISAPIGSTYIDTNATNGAIEWKKATGTGNTGWVVSVGSVNKTIVQSDLLNGWTLNGGRNVILSRNGNIVTLTIIRYTLIGTAATGNSILTIPSGYRASAINGTHTLGEVWIGSASQPNSTPVLQGAGSVLDCRVRDEISGTVSWVTSDAWPTA